MEFRDYLRATTLGEAIDRCKYRGGRFAAAAGRTYSSCAGGTLRDRTCGVSTYRGTPRISQEGDPSDWARHNAYADEQSAARPRKGRVLVDACRTVGRCRSSTTRRSAQLCQRFARGDWLAALSGWRRRWKSTASANRGA